MQQQYKDDDNNDGGWGGNEAFANYIWINNTFIYILQKNEMKVKAANKIMNCG